MARGSSTESTVVRGFNSFFRSEGLEGLAYRLRQHRFAKQVVDLVVDSRKSRYYLGIECKAIDPEASATLYFTQHFHGTDPEDNQVDRISTFLKQTGRTGWLVVEVHEGVGHPSRLYFVPWDHVATRFAQGAKGFRVEEIRRYLEAPKRGRNLVFTEAFFEALERVRNL